MILFKNLKKSFGGIPLFEAVTFQIEKGEKCALLGRNGSGKTTLLRLLAGVELPDEGEIRTPKGYRFGWLRQHFSFSSPTLIEEAALDLPEYHRYQAEQILQGLGFSTADFMKNPTHFSGGFQLRLQLCKVLLSQPDGLLLDEPTNYLDLPSLRWLQRFLAQWQGELFLISHDRSFIDKVCDSCVGIHRGKIRKLQGTTEHYYDTLLKEEEIHEKMREKIEKKKEHLQSFVTRFGAKASKAAQAQSKMKAIQKLSSLEALSDVKSLHFHFPFAPISSQLFLELSDVHFSYDETSFLLKEIALTVERGEKIGIIGKNGCGKSTLLKILAGECSPSQGRIKCAESVKIGYFGQTHIDRLDPQATIEQEILSAGPKLTFEEIRRICGYMLFEKDHAEKPVHVLSGGEKSRVLLGKILASACNLLLLDEPTHHLDIESIEALISALEDFQGSMIIVTHSEELLLRLSLSKIIYCKPGKQEVFLGSYEAFLEKRGWDEDVTLEKPTKQVAATYQRPSNRLSQLNREIQRIEKKWLTLEEEKDHLQEEILHLSTQALPPHAQIRTLTEQLEQKKRDSDRLFESLQTLQEEKNSL